MELKVIETFSAAHQLLSYKGDCSKLHGHTWKLEAVFKSRISLPSDNMVIDFKVLKDLVKSVIPDHEFLNTHFSQQDPTAEYLVDRIYTELSCLLGNSKDKYGAVSIKSLELWESDTASVKVCNEDL